MTGFRACFLALAFCAGCETIIDLDAPDYDLEVVVTSTFTPDSLWSASVHRSAGIDARQDVKLQFVDDATVVILTGDDIVDRLIYAGEGRYASVAGLRPKAGTQYTLRIETAGASRVEAVSTAPKPTPITDASLRLVSAGRHILDGDLYELTFHISDPAGTNWYRFGVYRYAAGNYYNAPDSVYRYLGLDTGEPSWYCGFREAHEPVPESSESNATCLDPVLTDRLFDGQLYTLKATMRLTRSSDGLGGSGQHGRNEVLVLLSTLSEDYFEYQRTVEDQTYGDPFAEPVHIYSNVKGGLGVFAGYSTTAVRVPIPP